MSSAKPFWFAFNVTAWLSSRSVRLMSLPERGAYIGLLALSWGEDVPGTLPADEDEVRRMAEMSSEQWAISGPQLLKKFPLSECKTYRYNPKLLAEGQEQKRKSELAAEAGRKSAEAKKQRKGNGTPTDVAKKPTNVEKTATERQLVTDTYTSSSNDERLTGRQAGEASASQVEKPTGAATVGGPARLVFPDEAEVFTKNGFREFVKSIGFGSIDIGHYLVQIQQAASQEAKPRPNSGKGLTWEGFVKNYLNNDRLHNRVVYPLPAEGQPAPQQQRYGPQPTATVATGSYDRQAIAARQATQIIT